MSAVRHLINVVFLAALCVTVGHTCGHVSPTLRVQLVGFTGTQHLGDTGVLGFTLACQAEFPGSRMCTSQEVMETTIVPISLTGEAWVRPAFNGFAGTYSERFVLDASGRNGSSGFSISCQSWTNAGGGEGLRVNSSGGFDVVACSQPHAVSCCAPLP